MCCKILISSEMSGPCWDRSARVRRTIKPLLMLRPFRLLKSSPALIYDTSPLRAGVRACATGLMWVCVYLKLLVLGVVIVSPLLQLSDLAVKPGHHRLPVIPQLPVPLLFHVQAVPQRQYLNALQVQLVLLQRQAQKLLIRIWSWASVRKRSTLRCVRATEPDPDRQRRERPWRRCAASARKHVEWDDEHTAARFPVSSRGPDHLRRIRRARRRRRAIQIAASRIEFCDNRMTKSELCGRACTQWNYTIGFESDSNHPFN